MNIRPVTKNDFNEWLQLWKGYQVFYKATISDEITKTTFDRFQDAREPVYCLVIENQEKQLIGLVHYLFHRSTWTIENYCYLQDLYVDPKHRASGLGRKLIEAVYAEAEKNHCSRVYWLTQENNDQARMLYDRIADQTGFIQYRKLFK
ncbi:GNAT family N-acetyltransferase [Acinetobacter ursingii]|uniref:N-acetyltransferase n=2 Tax=Acinetobacter ursingii TaxID=108980 RepID=A0A3D2SIX9_9GAMM|nr:GNAT family N-acetyltransferase [Acinetobacter ursingii]MCH2005136.1 GNAT family N-acetyltransferase [Acinetobacter ursingii]MCU4304595.1 GNAT family N-acetyltransferase [Acinetobacter ursingii]MCU4370600.1 GNAT family N-acetyltransferase [Acinetobacter ursingii]MCU4380151.1 GNAT family N-acetyltransferase [Acinetobacter ursingii]MCU4609214.1 GNAT family N-acetyltransferase [Acinetobacter ursingii]